MIYILVLFALSLFVFSIFLNAKISMPPTCRIADEQVILAKLLLNSYLKRLILLIILLSFAVLGITALSYLQILLNGWNSFYFSYIESNSLFLSFIFSIMIILFPAETFLLWYSYNHLTREEFQLLISYEQKIIGFNFPKNISRIIFLISLLLGLIGNYLIWSCYTCLTSNNIYYNHIFEHSPHNYYNRKLCLRIPAPQNYTYDEVSGFYIASYLTDKVSTKEIWILEMNDGTIITLFDLSPSQVMRILSLTGLEKVEPLPDRLK